MSRFVFLLPALLTYTCSTNDLLAKEYEVYYLGGQSNMDGYGKNAELPAELKGKVNGVWIFHGNTSPDNRPVDGKGKWSELQPGHGVGFRSDGEANQPSKRFGAELTFARELKKLRPGKNIAIIKYSRGGTSIHAKAAGNFGCWEPDFVRGMGATKEINQYDHFLATIRNAFAVDDIDGDGDRDKLVPKGIIWMQGESDAAHTEEIAKGYEANLKRLMDLIRAALRADGLPVVVGRISDSKQGKPDLTWKFGAIVRKAQEDFAASDRKAKVVTTTDGYGYSDPWHYDSKGYIDLGREFARSVHQLQK